MKKPVTLLTGFLGAGKTTLVNHLLSTHHDEKIMVIVNEFGDVGVDERLILRTDEEIIELAGGAICCMPKTDTTSVLLKLLENKTANFDRVLIETTGLANPTPIIRALHQKPLLQEHYVLDGVVTMVDASHVLMQLQTRPEAKVQIASADIVVINKNDLVDDQTAATVRMRIKKINPIAKVVLAENAQVERKDIFDIEGSQQYTTSFEHSDEHTHNDGVHSFVLRESRPLDLQKVLLWVGEHLLLNHENLLRYKGFLNIAGSNERFVFQGVHEQFSQKKFGPWPENVDRISEVVIIGTDLNKEDLEKSFAQTVATAA